MSHRKHHGRRHCKHSLHKRYGRSKLSYVQKTHIPTHKFALEARRQLPLIDAHHVRAAMARLSMMRHMHHVTPREYHHALQRIKHAAKHFGIHISE
jgi:hypothetical protein